MLFQCERSTDLPAPNTSTDFNCTDYPDVCELTEANSDFAITVFKAVDQAAAAEENLFISPLSISIALSMTMNGANGETLSEMLTSLRLDGKSLTDINESYKVLLEVLPNLDEQVVLKLANSIWYQNNYPVIPAFLDVNSMNFSSEVIPTDFAADLEGAIVEVNDWIETNTDGLIKDAISTLPGNVVMLLINAIYFKGSWQHEFDPELTYPTQFDAPSGSQTVEMMRHQEIELPYFENEMIQAVDVAYGDSIYSMSIFLPKEGYNIDDLMYVLRPESYQEWLSLLTPTTIELELPKFKIEYGTKLKPVLKTLGMEEAFSFRADFSQLVEGGGVKIDEVIHKAFIEVDEKGTEAAAVTIVILAENASFSTNFRADHPFVFVIRDRKTNSILFTGKLMSVEE